MKIGYARVSPAGQDLQSQLDGLAQLEVSPVRIYIDKGLTGRDRERPGLREAMAACHEGATLVVTKLDRLGRSARDLQKIADELLEKGTKLNIGGTIHDPHTPTGKLMFSVFAMMAEFEADMISQRTKEGMAIARKRGDLQGKKPKLSPQQDAGVLKRYELAGETVGEMAVSYKVARSSIYRALERARAAHTLPETGSTK